MKVTAIQATMTLFALCLGAYIGNSALKMGRSDKKFRIVDAGWTPPKTTIDPSYVDAAKALLGNGLGDPRGGKFCRVKVELGDAAWGRVSPKEAEGWESRDGKQVTLMDGVTYEIANPGIPLDLDAAMTAKQPMIPSAVRIDSTSPALPALLLLVSRPDLAERVFSERKSNGGQDSPQGLFIQLRQRYRMLAAQALMDRKDRMGLHWSDRLVAVAMVAKKLKQTEPIQPGVTTVSDLEFAKDLNADFARRVEDPKREPVDLVALAKLSKHDRIKTLIADLDLVAARQSGQPGGLEYFEDPILKALLAEGQDAVPDLIDTFADDKRFTRSISYGRDFFPERNFHTVKDAAWWLLTAIWPSSAQYRSDINSVADPAALRKAWSRDGKLTQPERWLAVLSDDHADPKSWEAAAADLVKPSDETHYGNFMILSHNPQAPMTGESLRAAHGTEVRQLIARRANEMVSTRTNSSMDSFSCGSALKMGHDLAKWDLPSSTECLKTICQKCLDNMPFYAKISNPREIFGGPFGNVIADRLRAKDDTAAKDYAKFLEFIKPDGWFLDPNIFKPLWEEKSDPEIQSVGEKFMADWTSALSSNDPQVAGRAIDAAIDRLINSRLLTVRSYRNLLAAGVRNKQASGTVQFVQTGPRKYAQYKFIGGSGSWNIDPADEDKVAIGQQIDIDEGDYFAQVIANLNVKESPHFQIYWPNEKRAKAKEVLAAWLQNDRLDWLAIVSKSPFFTMFQ